MFFLLELVYLKQRNPFQLNLTKPFTKGNVIFAIRLYTDCLTSSHAKGTYIQARKVRPSGCLLSGSGRRTQWYEHAVGPRAEDGSQTPLSDP